MAPAASIRNTSLLVGLIAVLCAAALALLIARSLTRPIMQLTEAVAGRGQQRQGRHSGRCARRDRRAGARVCAGDRGSRTQRPPRSSARFRSIAAPKRRATITPSASACSAPRSNPPTTPSSRCRSTAPSPAGIRPRSGCSDTRAAEAVGQNITLHRSRRPAAGDAGHPAPDRLGRTHRAQRNGATAQGRQPGRGLAQHLPDQVAVGRDHRHLEGRARHHRKPTGPSRRCGSRPRSAAASSKPRRT